MNKDKINLTISKRTKILEEKIKILNFLDDNNYHEEECPSSIIEHYSYFSSTSKNEKFYMGTKDSFIDGRIAIDSSKFYFRCDSFSDFINMYNGFIEFCSFSDEMKILCKLTEYPSFQYINGEIHSVTCRILINASVFGLIVFDKKDNIFKLVVTDLVPSGLAFYRDWKYMSEYDYSKINKEFKGIEGILNSIITTPNKCNFENVFPKLIIKDSLILPISSLL